MALIKQEDLEGLNNDIESLKQTILAINTELGDISKEITAVSGDLKKNEDHLTDLSVKIPLTEKIIDDAAAIIAANQAKISDNKIQLKDIDAQLAAADAAGDTDEVARLKALDDAIRKEIDDLSIEIDNQSIASTDAKVTLDQLLKDEADAKLENDAIKKHLADMNAEYNDKKSEVISLEQELAGLESSTLLKEYEEQVETRKNDVKQTIKNKERLMPLLKNTNTGLDQKMEEFVSDTSIFIKDIKTELEIDPIAEEIIKQSIAELNAEYEKKGSEGVFMASKALELSRKSLFDLELAGINKLIKAACYKGETSIDLMESEVTASQIIALDQGGYKITHKKNSKLYEQDDLVITIDWGFAAPVE